MNAREVQVHGDWTMDAVEGWHPHDRFIRELFFR